MDRSPNETARKLAEAALSRLTSELGAGRRKVLTTYLAAMGRFREHAWDNVLLIGAQRPDATQVASFHAWNERGRRVKKDERGILVFAPAEQTPSLSRARNGHLLIIRFRAPVSEPLTSSIFHKPKGGPFPNPNVKALRPQMSASD
jgi:hypothetical protein